MTPKQIESKERLLQGRKCAGHLGVREFFELIAGEVSTADSTIALDSKSLKAAFVEFGNRWFDNLPSNIEEITAGYAWPGYMSLLYECFQNWTFRSTALSVQFFKKFDMEPASALVYADGFGCASFLFATAFPRCQVTAHIMGAKQIEIARRIQDRLQLQNVVITDQAPTNAEVVLAFEAFEHFYDPIPVAQSVIGSAQVLIYTAPWAVRAHGHWPQYKGMNGGDIANDDFSKEFTRFLRGLGFVDSGKALNFKFFNAYPRIYIKP